MASDPSDMSVGSPADQQHEQELTSEDLVRRLRAEESYAWIANRVVKTPICQEAADTIERLEQELDDLTREHDSWVDATNAEAEVRQRLKRELDSERKMHAIAKAFHDVAVQQRNSAWQAGERLKRELAEARLQAQADRSFQVTNQKLKAELAEARAEQERLRRWLDESQQEAARDLIEARKEAARERGWRKIAQQRLKRANLPEPEWPIDAAKEGE